MRKPSRQDSWGFRAATFGLLPLLLGLAAARYALWDDAVWLTTAGGFWPIVLSIMSAGILVKLAFSAIKDMTSSVAAWLTLLTTWFYVPMWLTALEVPYGAAVIARDGRVHLASNAARRPEHRIWLLTHQAGNRIVHNVVGKLTASRVDIAYRFKEPYIGTRRNGEDLARTLSDAANEGMRKIATGTRAQRVAAMTDPASRERIITELCRAATGDGIACPLTMTLSPEKDATFPGELWSMHYTEAEAIEERHLPTLLQLLTQADSPVVERDKIFRLLLDGATSLAPLAQLAQKSHALDDGQFDEIVRRLLASPGCNADVIAIVAGVSRLSDDQRRALRTKAFAEADVALLVDNASRLRLSDVDLGALDARLRAAFSVTPAVAVSALKSFGERLPLETQRAAVAAIAGATTAHALAAIETMTFSTGLRRTLMAKILGDAVVADFAGWSKERLQSALTRSEMRALIATAVSRSEGAEEWLEFALKTLPVRDMTPAERGGLLNGLLFKAPKAALEFVSKHRDYLEPHEVGEITRDYTRTITPDFCLHLSHRNTNWRTKYFSEAQLQIFRDCAGRQ